MTLQQKSPPGDRHVRASLHDTQRSIEHWWLVLTKMISCMTVAIVAYFVFRSIDSLAGITTEANITLNSNLADHVSYYLLGTAIFVLMTGLVSIYIAYVKQGDNQKSITTLYARLRKLEHSIESVIGETAHGKTPHLAKAWELTRQRGTEQ